MAEGVPWWINTSFADEQELSAVKYARMLSTTLRRLYQCNLSTFLDRFRKRATVRMSHQNVAGKHILQRLSMRDISQTLGNMNESDTDEDPHSLHERSVLDTVWSTRILGS